MKQDLNQHTRHSHMDKGQIVANKTEPYTTNSYQKGCSIQDRNDQDLAENALRKLLMCVRCRRAVDFSKLL